MMADSAIYSSVFDVDLIGLSPVEVGIFERIEINGETGWKVLHGCIHFQFACDVCRNGMGAVWSPVLATVGVCPPDQTQCLKVTDLAQNMSFVAGAIVADPLSLRNEPFLFFLFLGFLLPLWNSYSFSIDDLLFHQIPLSPADLVH